MMKSEMTDEEEGVLIKYSDLSTIPEKFLQKRKRVRHLFMNLKKIYDRVHSRPACRSFKEYRMSYRKLSKTFVGTARTASICVKRE